MSRLKLCLLFCLSGFLPLGAQVVTGGGGGSGGIRSGAALPLTCTPGSSGMFFLTSGSIGLHQCLVTDTWTQIPTSGGSNPAWNDVSAPSANASLSMAARTTTWTWGNATGASNLLTLRDTNANTGTGYLFDAATVGTSTVKPLRVCAKGTSNCVTIDASAIMSASGTATILATSLAGGSSGQVPYQSSAGVTAFAAGFAYNAGVLGLSSGYTAGQVAGTTGTYAINGLTSGTVTLSAADAAGTWTLKFPTTAGAGAGLPVLSGSPWTYATVTGNTTRFPTWTGATTAARCVHTDASGNLLIAAADCGTGGGTWGSITGTLSAQSDLNTALGLKVPTSTTVNGQALSGNVTVTTITGNAGTATALAANGTNCLAGNYPLGVDASGNAEGCTAATGSGDTTGAASSTDTAAVRFSGTGGKTLQNSGVLIDTSNNVTANSFITTGCAGCAGGIEMKQGTANTPAVNTVLRQAPASVATAYTVLEATAAGTGFYLGTNSSNTVTTTQVTSTGSGSVVLATAPTITLPNATGLPLTTGVTGTLPVANLPTTSIPQKFFVTAAPGSITGNLPGDLATDTTSHHEYVCNAPSGTAAPACTAVATAGWLQLDSVGGTGCTVGGSSGDLQKNNGSGGCVASGLNDNGSLLKASEPISLGSAGTANGISITATAGSGGVTANLIAAKDTSNPTAYVIPGSGGCGSGIAASTVSAAAIFELYVVPGTVLTGVADNAITAGHILTGGTSTPGRVRDSGQTSRSAIDSGTCIMGVAQASQGSAGSTVLFRYDGAGAMGSQTNTIDGVTVTGTPTAGQVPTATGGSAATWQTAYTQTVQSGGSPQTQRAKLNFAAGANVTITPSDNGSDTTTLTIAATGGGSTGLGRTTLSPSYTAIPDGACQSQTATWTGVTTSDTITLGAPAGLAAGLLPVAFVSAADTVAIRLCNLSGAAVTPGSTTFAATLAVYNLSGSGTIDFASISDGACLSNTFTLTGIAASDPVVSKWPSTLEAGLFGSMIASATNTVQVRLCNFSGSPVDPASQSFGASVAK